jgi:NAD-dependent deacetylase
MANTRMQQSLVSFVRMFESGESKRVEMTHSLPSMVERVASWLCKARHAVVFTGAGISTESGIPDFRSPGGVWSRNRPVYYEDFLASPQARFEYWRQKSEAAYDFERAEPNSGHLTIARWEQIGRLAAVITQNIDGLHQQAGNRKVLELHGTARSIQCVDCQQRFEPKPLFEMFGSGRSHRRRHVNFGHDEHPRHLAPCHAN